eukprot:2027679-Amphidinium_carterae.1
MSLQRRAIASKHSTSKISDSSPLRDVFYQGFCDAHLITGTDRSEPSPNEGSRQPPTAAEVGEAALGSASPPLSGARTLPESASPLASGAPPAIGPAPEGDIDQQLPKDTAAQTGNAEPSRGRACQDPLHGTSMDSREAATPLRVPVTVLDKRLKSGGESEKVELPTLPSQESGQ